VNIDDLIDREYKYIKAGEEELNELYGKFAKGISDVPSILKEEATIDDIGICEDTIIKIIEQVRKRKLYFHIYHDINGLNELKETSLYCFWILKLQPFFWRKKCENKPNYELNAKVALHLFIKGLKLYMDEMNKKNKSQTKFNIHITESIIENLYYSFRFRDWSKEAIMDLAESFVVTEIEE
jgi:hypothetical protein